MSSYLNIYGQLKSNESQYVNLVSFSSSHEIYQHMSTFITYGEYTSLTVQLITEILDELKSDMDRWEKRIIEYEKYAGGNLEIIDEIIEYQDYFEDLRSTYYKIMIIRNIIKDAEEGLSDFKSIKCNIV